MEEARHSSHLAAWIRRGVLGISEMSAALRGMKDREVTRGLLEYIDLVEFNGVKRLLMPPPMS